MDKQTEWERAYAAMRAHKPTSQRHKVPKTGSAKKPVRPFIPNDTIALKSRLASIKLEIAALKAERKQIAERLKSPARLTYDKRNWTLYVLRLQNDCWYVGITKNLEKRYQQHIGNNNKGSNWTRKYRPIEIHETRDTGVFLESEASLIEDQVTLEYARLYGTDFVRGGGYCQTKPLWPQELSEPDVSWITV